MARALAIDYGKVRCGIAVSDPMRMIATPLVTVSTEKLKDWLAAYFSAEVVDTVVVGVPMQLKGGDTHSSEMIRIFIAWFKEQYPEKELATIDERFTSSEAQRSLIINGIPKNKRKDKSLLDTISATLILQTFLQKI